MGMFKIEITAVGGHGCDRNAKEGEPLAPPCDNPSCPDCAARAFVEKFKAMGCLSPSHVIGDDGTRYDTGATLIHWPNQKDGGIVDDLLSGVRKRGHF